MRIINNMEMILIEEFIKQQSLESSEISNKTLKGLIDYYNVTNFKSL